MKTKGFKNLKCNFCAFFNKNRVKFLVVTALFFGGIIIGAICDVKNVSDDNLGYMNNFASAYKLQGVSSSEIFFRALISYLRIFAFIWLSGRFVFLIPLNLFSVAAKGFGLGFTISYLIRWSGFGGIIFGFLILFAQNIIFIPVMLIYSVYQLNFVLEYGRIKQNGALFKQTKRLIVSDIKISAAVIATAIVCCCIEAYIIPSLIMPMC